MWRYHRQDQYDMTYFAGCMPWMIVGAFFFIECLFSYLQNLWKEISQMSERHCSALLLNLRDDQGCSALDLFLFAGLVTIKQIALAVGLSEEELSTLWNDLPLEDSVIADRLRINRQQVINLRKSARERLGRRMKQIGF